MEENKEQREKINISDQTINYTTSEYLSIQNNKITLSRIGNQTENQITKRSDENSN